MSSIDLMRAYHRAHLSADRAALDALFGERGILSFHGQSSREARGAAAISELLAGLDRGDARVLGQIAPWLGGGVSATYGPDEARVAGEIRVLLEDGRLSQVEVYALPEGPVYPRERTSIRALLLAPGPQVLLFECHEQGKPGSWWITPGGGRQEGEDDEAALRRELEEEVGLRVGPLGPCVWQRTHTFVWKTGALTQRERYYVVPVERAVEPPAAGWDEGTLRYRWWSLEELEQTDVLIAPRALPQLLGQLLRDGPPESPIEAGL